MSYCCGGYGRHHRYCPCCGRYLGPRYQPYWHQPWNPWDYAPWQCPPRYYPGAPFMSPTTAHVAAHHAAAFVKG